MTNLKIIVDTREQNPLSFTLPTERGTLETGDYSLKGLERFISIERKAPNDLVSCLKKGHAGNRIAAEKVYGGNSKASEGGLNEVQGKNSRGDPGSP